MKILDPNDDLMFEAYTLGERAAARGYPKDYETSALLDPEVHGSLKTNKNMNHPKMLAQFNAGYDDEMQLREWMQMIEIKRTGDCAVTIQYPSLDGGNWTINYSDVPYVTAEAWEWMPQTKHYIDQEYFVGKLAPLIRYVLQEFRNQIERDPCE